MKFVVFEAGGRAGFSAEMFFLDYIKKSGNYDDILYMVDDSCHVNEVYSIKNVKRISFPEFLCLEKKDLIIFPADELTRQSKHIVYDIAKKHPFSEIESWYYNKKLMNQRLNESTCGCKIRVPNTFDIAQVCIRPNTMSAGSKGIQILDDVSITEKINIVQEYVVDVLRNENDMILYPRAVFLKNGYDRLIKHLKEDSEICLAAKEFILSASPTNEGVFSNIFHLQLAEDINGDFYYIESSKRISGTSIVNLFRGMNPFNFIIGIETEERVNPFEYNKLYRYEDFIRALAV